MPKYQKFLDLQALKNLWSPHDHEQVTNSAMIGGIDEDERRSERLNRLRVYMGNQIVGRQFNQRQFAAFLGVDYPRYNNAERGYPISRQLADIIVAKCPGVTRDWLTQGIEVGMPMALVQALREAPIGSGRGRKSRRKGTTSGD